MHNAYMAFEGYAFDLSEKRYIPFFTKLSCGSIYVLHRAWVLFATVGLLSI